jgi:hypothetical protein
MTTPLAKPVRRRTLAPHRRGRRVVVSMVPGDVLTFRDERTRTEYSLPVGFAYDMAVKLHVAAKRAEKKRARRR